MGKGKNTLFSGHCSACCVQLDARDSVDSGVPICSKETARLKSPVRTNPPTPSPEEKDKSNEQEKKNTTRIPCHLTSQLSSRRDVIKFSVFSDEDIEVQRSRCCKTTHSHLFHMHLFQLRVHVMYQWQGQWELWAKGGAFGVDNFKTVIKQAKSPSL